MSFAKNAADAISAARDAAVGEATGADEPDAAKNKRRRIIALLSSLGALGAVGTAGYLGYKHRDAIAEKGRGALKSVGVENDKPGFWSRLWDKSTDTGALTGAATAAAAPGSVRTGVNLAAKAGVPGAVNARSTPTNRWAHQTTGEKVRTALQRVVLGEGPQNTASGLAKRLEAIRARGDTPAVEGGGKGATSSKWSDLFGDPHTQQAEVIAKQLGPKGTQGTIDLLRKDQGRLVDPKVDIARLRERLIDPVNTVKPAGQGGNTGLSAEAQEVARAIKPDPTNKKGAPIKVPEATMRDTLLHPKAPLSDFAPAYRAAPRKLVGHLGRGLLGALIQGGVRAWGEPEATP